MKSIPKSNPIKGARRGDFIESFHQPPTVDRHDATTTRQKTSGSELSDYNSPFQYVEFISAPLESI